MKKSMAVLIATAFVAGSALAQTPATPMPADKGAATEQKAGAGKTETMAQKPKAAASGQTTSQKAAKSTKKKMTKEEKKAAFAQSHAEMQKQSGAKFPTAQPPKKKAEKTAAKTEPAKQ